MPNTYSQLMFHVVFSTKNRERTLTAGHREKLYKYIWAIHENLKCHLYRIGGVDDHVHILTGTPTTLSIAKYVQEIKASSSHWLKSQADFPRFESWQDGYGAFTVSYHDNDRMFGYIKGQEEHHRDETLLDEYRRLLIENGITFDEQYLARPVVSPLRGCAFLDGIWVRGFRFASPPAIHMPSLRDWVVGPRPTSGPSRQPS